jgi:hypothetical protein
MVNRLFPTRWHSKITKLGKGWLAPKLKIGYIFAKLAVMVYINCKPI